MGVGGGGGGGRRGLTSQHWGGVDDGDGDAGGDPRVHLPKVQPGLLNVHCRQDGLALDHQLHRLASPHLHHHLPARQQSQF